MRTLITLICLLIPFPRIRRPLRRWLKTRLESYANCYNWFLLRRYMSGRNTVLWFDHAFGGGTRTYSMRQFKEMRRKGQRVLRIQYFPAYKYFLLTTPTRFRKLGYVTNDLNLLFQMKISEIVVNNLVGYTNPLATLNLIARLKRAMPLAPHVSFRGHDFHSICPSYCLINCNNVFCNLKYSGGCDACLRKKRMTASIADKGFLNRGKIYDWRMGWGKFFAETLDEIIVFSDAIRDIFLKIYPQLADKIVVIPHATQDLRRVSVMPHNEINIACIGYMLQCKGRDIIIDMCKNIKKTDNVNMFVIGEIPGYNKPFPQNLIVTGRYNPCDLPKLIERHKIDLIFISSIWPETFSYTASEAMSMGIPVACYNMGAPAERIGKYEHGLVLSKISPKKNLKEIITFVKQKRKDA